MNQETIDRHMRQMLMIEAEKLALSSFIGLSFAERARIVERWQSAIESVHPSSSGEMADDGGQRSNCDA